MAVLSGKVALVTGGSRGIGAAIARRLAADGAAVAITYASSPDAAGAVVAEIESNGGKALALRADSGDADAVKGAVDETVKVLGRLDILVNNAGVVAVAPIQEFSLDEFDRLVAVNVRAVFVAAKAAVLHMGEGGRIITIGSVNADRVPFEGGSVYALTKAAVAGFTRGLSRDLGPRGITANTVQPGPVDTDMNPADGQFAAFVTSSLSVGRYGRTDEVASLVAFLARPDSGYVNGATLSIDGGFLA